MHNTTFHTVLGFCGWDIVAGVIFAAVVITFAIRHKKLKAREKELKDKVLELSNN